MLVSLHPLDALRLDAPQGVPWPGALYGALAKRICGEERQQFRLRGPVLRYRDQFVFPVPNGLVTADGVLSLLSPVAEESSPAPLWVRGAAKVFPLSGFLTWNGMRGYLQGVAPVEHELLPSEAIFVREGTRVRYRDGVSICLWTEGVAKEVLNNALVPLGGAGRRVHALVEPDEKSLEFTPPSGRGFKLVLATPAIYSHGWRPSWLSPDGQGELAGAAIRLAAFASPGALHYSGWDSARGEPRRTRRAMPAGSEYFFEASGAPDYGVINQQAISDHRPYAGYGLSFVGTWRYA